MTYQAQIKTDKHRRTAAARRAHEAVDEATRAAFKRGQSARHKDMPLNIHADAMEQILQDAYRQFARMIAIALYEKVGPQVAHYATDIAQSVVSEWHGRVSPEKLSSFQRYQPAPEEWVIGLTIPTLHWQKTFDRMEVRMLR